MEPGDRRALRGAMVVLGLVLTLVTFTGPRGLLGGDEGVKLIQAFGVLDNGLGDPAIPYPARAFDPGERNHPVVPPHIVRHHGKRYGIYPITFTAPAAVAWKVGGFWGLHVVPLAGGLVAVWMTMLLALLCTGDRRWAIVAGAVVVAATPLSIYTALFNEHAPGVGLFMAGLWGVAAARTGPGQVGSGAALALAATLRGELIAAAPAVLVFALAYHGVGRDARWRLVRVALGAIVVMGGFLLYNWATTGEPLPGVAANRAVNRPKNRDALLPLLYEPRIRSGPPPVKTLIAAALVGALLLWQRVPRWCGWIAGAIAVWLWCWVSLTCLHHVRPGVGDYRTAVGLFSATPILVVGLLVGLVPADDRRRRVLACVGCAITATVAIFYTDADGQAGGLQFGARHLLVVAPLLVIGAVAVVRAVPWWLRIAAIGPLVLALWASSMNVRAWHAIAGKNATLTAAAARSPSRDLFSGFFWGPEVLAPLWHERRISLANDPNGPIDRLEAAGITEVTQVLSGLKKLEERGRLAPIETLDARDGVIRYRIVPRPAP